VSLVCPTSGCRGEDVTRAPVFTALVPGPDGRQPVLQRGSRGPEVAAWQALINRVQDPDIAVDGLFGHGTTRATRQFQRAHGLAADGVVGPHTRTAMARLLEVPKAQSAAAVPDGLGRALAAVLAPLLQVLAAATPRRPANADTLRMLGRDLGGLLAPVLPLLVQHFSPASADAARDGAVTRA
jgi:peptidoglycan hydrolase-like protein with peptidoglycan-binding domain